ncbi:hypothetical protein GCM10008107_23410 [Psychrosphaera saromensis]|uniref:Uncharacterized protein n=1 Tax=Psychrosphaera saromensis TaxID=716813 RepID=A0A2S7URL3_9GAMM|nr:hypothetical protein [Psychrosphaera saromensis]PQJ52379.1 hypothetical protein BTO11_01070 [Psychrosphaera saromensis]GHB73268.1 hypothetical protein GCM10008107_23410 [Psychrosphaera saromensis]GLQ13456.1 hypothetical protein GCM10007917_09110 [Psychrosphaera saromensis]
MSKNNLIGIGSDSPTVILHIANRPPVDGFAAINGEEDINRPLQVSEAASIIQQTGNHWRKVFSILAKISFALFDTGCKTWQEYRDTKLLTEQGFEYICFSSLVDTRSQLDLAKHKTVSIVCGFSYAQSQLDVLPLISHQKFDKLKWSEPHQCLVTPYFDWRQLNNEMLDVVINILKSKLDVETLPL